jgi:DNA-binding transcriptional MerR regulator
MANGQQEILETAMMTVIELAKRGGVAPNVIRYYSRVGLLTPERNQSNGYKLFRSEDIDRLRFIRLAQHLGYSLADIGKLLATVDEGDDPCAEMQAILQSRIVENRQRLADLTQMQARMERACRHWKHVHPEAEDLDALCDFIETLGGKAEVNWSKRGVSEADAPKVVRRQAPGVRSAHNSVRPSDPTTSGPKGSSTRLEDVVRMIPGRFAVCAA